MPNSLSDCKSSKNTSVMICESRFVAFKQGNLSMWQFCRWGSVKMDECCLNLWNGPINSKNNNTYELIYVLLSVSVCLTSCHSICLIFWLIFEFVSIKFSLAWSACLLLCCDSWWIVWFSGSQPSASTASCTSGGSTPPRPSPGSPTTTWACSSPPTPSSRTTWPTWCPSSEVGDGDCFSGWCLWWSF